MAAPHSRKGSAASSASRHRRLVDYPRQGRRGAARWVPSWHLVTGTLIGLVFLALGGVAAAYAAVQVPEPDAFVTAQRTTVYYSDGTTPIGTFAEARRESVDFAALPAHVGSAVVASEDRTFWQNRGVDLRGIARAFLNNVRGQATQGGSTLTQQYVERYYVGQTTTSYLGKLKEALLAVKITQTQSKEQILGRYLNTIYFGRDSYGIQVAAQAYFGKDAKDLTVSQAALLAGIIPSPNNWDPAVSPQKAEQRWARVLDAMVEDGALTQADRDGLTFPTTVEYQRSNTLGGVNGYLLDMVRSELSSTGTLTEDVIARAGLSVVTTIDKDVQDQAVAAVGRLRDGSLAGAPPADATKVGVVSLAPADGAIVALYGGPDFVTDSVNRVTQDRISAGSTFKPFTLLAALDNGIPLTKTYSGRSPQTFGDWAVTNFGNVSYGRMDLVAATAQSVNTVYAQLNLDVGPDKTTTAAVQAGVRPTDLQPPVRSNVLGVDAVRPIDMASAYATIAAQGVHHDPFIVREARYLSDGTVAYQGGSAPDQRFGADVTADATYAMTQVVQARNGSAATYIKPLGRPIAGKTGTSEDNRSAWFIGFTPQIVTAVALSQVGDNGRDQVAITPFGSVRGRPVTAITGGSWPSALWADYMKNVFGLPAYAPVQDFPPRADVNRPSPTAEPTTAAPVPTQTTAPAQPAQATVPDGLVGQLQADAEAAVLRAGLQPTPQQRADPAPSGQVIAVDPAPGTVLPAGSVVTLVVSSGPTASPSQTPTATPAAYRPAARTSAP